MRKDTPISSSACSPASSVSTIVTLPNIEVDIATWQKAEKDRKAMDKFRDKEPAIWAGMDIFDIMKVTGHTTPEMLKRYIKADQLDVVQKLTDKYDHFD